MTPFAYIVVVLWIVIIYIGFAMLIGKLLSRKDRGRGNGGAR